VAYQSRSLPYQNFYRYRFWMWTECKNGSVREVIIFCWQFD